MVETRVNDVVAGHRLLERLGGGHYGEVWKADFMGQPVALKLFNRRRKVADWRREVFAQFALGRLQGADAKFFPRVEHVDVAADPAFLRMELIDGKPLEDLMFSPTAPLEERMALGLRILEALAAVHRHGYVHGDLSPSNVLVTRTGDIKLIDVGYGAIFDDGTSNDIKISGTPDDEESLGVASPLYAAPERFKAAFLKGCGKQADVFSFCKILYGLITGEQPFVIKPVSMKFRALGTAWDDFVFKGLEEKPEARFLDAVAALEEYGKLYKPEASKGEFRAECPTCHAKMSIPGGWAGERFPCTKCDADIEVLFYDDATKMASTGIVEEPKAVAEIEFIDDEKAKPADDGDVLIINDDGAAASAPQAPPPMAAPAAARDGTRAKKFCPRCGQSIYLEAKKCRFCGTWVDELARKIVETRSRRKPPS